MIHVTCDLLVVIQNRQFGESGDAGLVQLIKVQLTGLFQKYSLSDKHSHFLKNIVINIYILCNITLLNFS